MSKYSDKHQNAHPDQKLIKHLATVVVDNKISCRDAHEIAIQNQLSPASIGQQIDLAEYRIYQCRLGLFGYGRQHRKLNPDIEIPPALKQALEEAVNSSGRISCADCWDIAENLGHSFLDIGSACEKMDLRIKPCQLGAF